MYVECKDDSLEFHPPPFFIVFFIVYKSLFLIVWIYKNFTFYRLSGPLLAEHTR